MADGDIGKSRCVYLYLPIAEMTVNVFAILSMGLGVGFVSGMFGVGGGFLLTPLLIFIGIPPAIAVSTVSGQIAAASMSSTLSFLRRKSADIQLAKVLLLGGMIGSLAGVTAFSVLKRAGQLDVFIALSYLILMGFVGGLMVIESVRTLRRKTPVLATPKPLPPKPSLVAYWPWQMTFEQSNVTTSGLAVMLIGFSTGILGAVMGIGGGFILVPMLIYILKVPTLMVVGTATLQTLVTMCMTLFLHAATNGTVDLVLALLLMIGGVIGAQFGARMALIVRSDLLRLLLGLLALAVASRFLFDLALTPSDLFSVSGRGGS